MSTRRNTLFIICFASTLLIASCQRGLPVAGAADDSTKAVDWPVYGGNPAGDRYSELTQINRTNVDRLKIAWRYDTGEGGLQTSPLMLGRRPHLPARRSR